MDAPTARLILLLCLAGPALAQGQSAPDRSWTPDSVFARSLDGDHLETAGRMAPASLLDALLGYASIDGTTRLYRPPGGGLPSRYSPVVLLDGVRIELDWLGRLALGLLPVAPGAVESLDIDGVSSPDPGLVEHGGVVSIRSRPPTPGWSLTGGVTIGNPEGDPGPYAFTRYASPNIDRSGPSYGFRLARAGRRGGFSLSLNGDEAHVTDARLKERVGALYRGDTKPTITSATPTVSFWRLGPRSRHRVISGYGVQRDLLYLDALGQELPTTRRHLFASGAGHWLAGPRWAFTYAFGIRRADLDPRENRQNLNLDWAQERMRLRLGLMRGQSGVVAGFRSHRFHTSRALLDWRAVMPYFGVRVVRRTASEARHQLDVQAVYTAEDPSRPARLLPAAIYVRSPASTGWRVRLTYASEALEWRDDSAYWLMRGWRFPGAAGDRTDLPPYVLDSRTATADAAWQFLLPAGGRLAVGVRWRRFLGQTLPEIRMVPDPRFESRYTGRYTLQTGVGGQVWGSFLALDQQLRAAVAHRLHVELLRPVSGDDYVFWQHWSRLPRFLALYRLFGSPVPRIHLLMQLAFESRTEWPEFPDPLTDRPAELPSRLRIDLSAAKALWGPRATAFARLEHITGTRQTLHPLGAEERLTLRVGLVVRFEAAERR